MGMRLKLLVSKDTNKVIFAEAGKEFVDFLMGLMEIPLGSILRLLKENVKTEASNTLSLEKLYESIRSFEESYLQKSDLRNSVLDPKLSTENKVKQAPLLKQLIQGGSSSFSTGSRVRDEIDGYVKGASIYMVEDDLTISPSSTISSICLCHKNGIKDTDLLQEKIVEVDGKKASEMVSAAFQSSTVLTDVFTSKDGSIKATH